MSIDSISFFELKYLIIDTFYSEWTRNGYTPRQAWGICYESFTEYIISETEESVVAICTIIRLKLRHKIPLDEYDTKEIQKAIRLYEVPEIKAAFNEIELEYLEEDIEILKASQSKLG